MQYDVRTAVCLLYVLNLKLWTTIAAPLYGLCTLFVAACDDVHLLAYHERRVETQTEMTDDCVGVILVFVEEIGYARERNLIDIFVNLLLGHTDTAVADGQRAFLCVETDANGKVAQFALEVAAFGKRL